jgi:hypothetical protein
MSDSTAVLEPDALFVIACPVCMGQVAATGSLCGHDACCPLCASLFHVPWPMVPEPPAPPATERPHQEQPAGLAEDWGGVIRQLTPPGKDPAPALTPERDLTPEPAPTPTMFELAEAVTEPSPTEAQPSGGRGLAPAADGLPVVGGTPLDPQATELVFAEPVRTVRYGDTEIEIRRLTPEERRSRRFRRNVVMVVVGVSILLAIVLVFGVPKKP